jgi:nucleoside 2-deoxyribosyltransferase
LTDLNIMVCGSIGYGNANDIKNMYTLLRSKGFSLINHIIHEGMDYSDIRDFRDKSDLSHQIVNHDLQYIEKSDVIVVIANGPSYGTAIEMYVAKNSGKKIILLAKDAVPTPWPVHFSDYIVGSENELFDLLYDLEKKQ